MTKPLHVAEVWTKLQSDLELRGESWKIDQYRLLGMPEILPNEIFSSWVWRSIAVGALTPGIMKSRWKIRHAIHWVDIDSSLVSIPSIEKTLNGFNVDALQSTIFNAGIGLNTVDSKCLTSDPFNKRPVYRFCPECFRQDKIQYVRKNWRFSFTYVCEQHQVLLQEKCPHCLEYFSLNQSGFDHGTNQTHKPMRWCLHCGEDMCEQLNIAPDSRVISLLVTAQNRMLEFLNFEVDTHAKIFSTIMFINHFDGVRSKGFGAGICGPKLFLNDADLVKGFMSKYQLYSNTFWYQNNSIYIKKLTKSFKSILKWLTKDTH